MSQEIKYASVNDWIESLLSTGKIAFSANQVQEVFQDLSSIAIKRSLDRLSKKQKIVSIYRGYYLIITPQYSSKGIVPPSLYIDSFMRFLGRSYYVGLLSAAAYHGAAHQQPQEFYVITSLPALRPTLRKGTKVNYIVKNFIDNELIETRNVESGYIKISSPALTAVDLIQFEKRVGGLNRVATILNELVEVIKPDMFSSSLISAASTYSIQRLGYLLEHILNQKELAQALFDESKKSGLPFFRVPLRRSIPEKGFPADQKWKVIVNTEIEVDE